MRTELKDLTRGVTVWSFHELDWANCSRGDIVDAYASDDETDGIVGKSGRFIGLAWPGVPQVLWNDGELEIEQAEFDAACDWYDRTFGEWLDPACIVI